MCLRQKKVFKSFGGENDDVLVLACLYRNHKSVRGSQISYNALMTDHYGAGVEIGAHVAPHDSSSLNKIVVASFNIRYGVGSFLITGSLLRRLSIKRSARRSSLVARHLNRAAQAFGDGRLLPSPHLIALQEADRDTIRAGRRHVARELAQKLEMNYAHVSAIVPRNGGAPKRKQWYLDFEEHIAPNEDGATGLAVLSRLPMIEVTRIELPWNECAWRPRLALHAVIPYEKGRLHFFNAHIDPHADVKGQLAQHETIIADADKAGDEPVIFAGDFNTLNKFARAGMRRTLEAHGYATPFPDGTATWRAGLYRLQADWIFTRNIRRITRWGVARPLGVSDHWPVWAEIEL